MYMCVCLLLVIKDIKGIPHLQGWRQSADDQTEPYYLCKDELSIQDGYLLRGSRVVVPPAGRQAVLNYMKLTLGYPV